MSKRWRWPLVIWLVADLWTDVPFAVRKSAEVSALVFAVWMWFADTWLPLVTAWLSTMLVVVFVFAVFTYWRMRGINPGAALTVVLMLALVGALIRWKSFNRAVGATATS